MRRVVVTGGAGFIGSHLVESLLWDGCEVWVIDNLITGQRKNLNPHPNLHVIINDCIKPAVWDLIPESDEVYHIASPAAPQDYLAHPIETMEAASIGTKNALEFAKRMNAKLLYTSTSEVYGDPLVSPQAETYWGNVNPVGPRSVYDEAKRYAEALITAYAAQHGVRATIVRIFNTYGPRMRKIDGRAVPNFIQQALAEQPLTIYGKGEQTRSFCYVEDTVKALKLLMAVHGTNYQSGCYAEGSKGMLLGPVNIGNPKEVTIMELAKTIIKITKSKSKFTHLPLPQDDPKVRCPNIVRLWKLTQWEPEWSLDDGLKETVRWMQG